MVFNLAFWGSACMTGLLLLINRSLDIINSDYADMLFGGKKTFVWMIFPLLFGGYICVFTTPFLFNSIMDASMLNPYMGIPEIKVDIQEVVKQVLSKITQNIGLFLKFNHFEKRWRFKTRRKKHKGLLLYFR